MQLFIDPRNLELGVVNTSVAIIEGVHIPKEEPPHLAELRQEALQKAKQLTPEAVATHPVLDGYRQIYRALGYHPGEIEPAAESLIKMVARRDRFPQINAAVDAYNTVVVEMLVGIGAHDLDKLQSPVVFTLATGDEQFKPLASKKFKPVPKGDFLYKDASNLVLARLASDDCDDAKLGSDTRNILMVIEGHANTPLSYTRHALEQACALVVGYCGGSFTITQPALLAT